MRRKRKKGIFCISALCNLLHRSGLQAMSASEPTQLLKRESFSFCALWGICGEPSASVLAGYTSHGQVPIPHSSTTLSASFPLKPISLHLHPSCLQGSPVSLLFFCISKPS